MIETRNKDNAKNEWLDMVAKSWTWALLNQYEKQLFLDRVEQFDYNGEISGTYNQRWGILNALYTVYLDGIGRDEIDRRETMRP